MEGLEKARELDGGKVGVEGWWSVSYDRGRRGEYGEWQGWRRVCRWVRLMGGAWCRSWDVGGDIISSSS
jgi:hypothetical protein